ncbi:anaerobic C4-dicarboxylate transporter DcuC [Pasteurellaceae bacterium HPA106]|uniref:anaerobic C4-dicarboxylate transporter DcuC n=1 Tax=Spirabiliibacterium pneumoniae TaxID=221400 RepID=UPI001AAD4E0E|nr:anaerobic C4-dicarboxylate transporter DcuC [Spirabiliibacterium pneumoniae]MBE2897224.1 anaerobic C4-dicarboxylate transporter DcuC [Spirabiliibacterium pneumoniae]
MGLLLGFLTILLVGWLIIKHYNAKGVLFCAGILLLIIAAVMGHSPLKESTGTSVTDIMEYIYSLMEKRGGGLGLLIMILIGFSYYMSEVGANDVVVRVLCKPLRHIKSPYLLLVGGYLIAYQMSFAISSATALGVFLMATLFPIMTRLGISAPSAAAVCATTSAVNLNPTAADVILAAEKAGTNIVDFSFFTILPMSIVALLAIAITHFFWQRFCDRQEGLHPEQLNYQPNDNVDPSTLLKTDAPTFYIILPFLPIAGLLLFNGETLPKLSLGAVVVLTIIITAVIEFIRKRSARAVYEGIEVCYNGMAEAFSGVVMLLVAAGVFAEGLNQIGFIRDLIDTAQQFGSAALIMMLTLVVITMLVTIASGSGNAAFYAFVEIAPKLATHLGINPAYLIAPMVQVSNTARGMSPVSGVIVAVSGAGNLSPLLLVKRTSVPLLVGAIVIVLYTIFAIPTVG